MFFFFKQKTAYEMRISDWSSDVCSSDLPAVTRRRHYFLHRKREGRELVHLLENLTPGRIRVRNLEPYRNFPGFVTNHKRAVPQIGRASCRERVCQYV